VSLISFGSFSHGKGHFTVWLKPEPTETLLDLHATIWAAVSYDEDYAQRIGEFTPHLSMGQTQREELLAELPSNWEPVSFRVADVCLIARQDPPNDMFEIVKKVALGPDV
jgi:2'-5' RNA ligase